MHELGSGLGAPTPAPYCQLRQGSRTHVTFGSGVRKTSKTCSAELSAYLLAPLCPRLTSGITSTVWVECLSCLVFPPLSLSMVWYGSTSCPSSVRSGRFSPTGGVTSGTARGVDEHFCHATQVRATRVPEHSGCCCFSSRHSAARCSRHAEGAGGLVEDVPVGHGESSGPTTSRLAQLRVILEKKL